MPRTARASVAGTWYHVLNRGDRREVVFHKPADYDAFVKAMSDATARLGVDILGYCVMPNHFHLLMRTNADGDLGRWVWWLLVAHAQRYHRHYHTTGHVWQGRYRLFLFKTMIIWPPSCGISSATRSGPDLVRRTLEVVEPAGMAQWRSVTVAG